MESENSSMKSGPILLVLSAPSGAGKSTLCDGLIRSNPEFTRVVTCTTRSPRPGESDGLDYIFWDRPTFLEKVRQGEFIEFAEVFGHLYGTLKSTVMENLQLGSDMVLNIDVQGAASVRLLADEHPGVAASLVTVFVAPPTRSELKARLMQRGADELSVIETRLSQAGEEVQHWIHFDYIIVSGSKEQDLERLQAVVTAEKIRAKRVHFRFDEKL